ncbi:Ger(x)C family spore germination protein [Heliorestis acidaminivorans]|uniref:Ger(X)C family spore germination protein n=1 Tax=Heliorestis acidaminivorans TaxID=553427 RepID=A0A6I0EST2_9FIRM|nr:Ger(x)C family spore germination protein [Heliorestis acidaminivorans]KAB2951971.1 Ger(x)C family spore germination protein [Heliorestis acidaminivorans]
MRKTMYLTIVLLLSSFLNGCWDRQELNQLSIVTAAAIDKVDEEYMLTTSIIRPVAMTATGGDGGTSTATGDGVWIALSYGSTIHEAEIELNRRASRTAYWGQNRIIVIGEEVAREGVHQVIDMLTRYPELRLNTWILVARGLASDIVVSVPQLEKSASAELTGLITRQEGWAHGQKTALFQILRNSNSPAKEPLITAVTTAEIHPANLEHEGQQPTPSKGVEVYGCAVLKEGKLVGWLDKEETLGAHWIIGDIERRAIFIDGPDGKPISIQLLDGESQFVADLTVEPHKITIFIETEGNIIENQGNREIETTESFQWLGKEVEREIQRELNLAIEKSRAYQSDFFGFGRTIYRQDPSAWRQLEAEWSDYLAEKLVVETVVTVTLRRAGMNRQFINP